MVGSPESVDDSLLLSDLHSVVQSTVGSNNNSNR